MNTIITIGRQCGANGSAIGQRLSEILNIPCYDRDSLVLLAEEQGIPRETFDRADKQATSSFLYSMAMSSYSGSMVHFGINDNNITDRVFNIQSDEIKKLALSGSCIFIGRCADDVLDGVCDTLKVFIHAPIDKRILQYISENPGTDESSARKAITKEDKKRASYYNFYTGKGWGDPKNYHLNVDSSVFGVEGAAQIIKNAVELLK